MGYLNNFRFVNSYEKKPESLNHIEDYGEFEIYHSEYNTLVYVFLNSNDGRYYSYESNGECFFSEIFFITDIKP